MGITWLARGFPYWRRRVLWSLFYFLAFAVGAAGSAGFIIAFLTSHTPLPVRVILVATAGCVIAGCSASRWVGMSASRWVGMTGCEKCPADGVGGAWWCSGCRGGGLVGVVSRSRG